MTALPLTFSSFRGPALAAIAALALPLASADAATITYQDDAPSFDENDIVQLSIGADPTPGPDNVHYIGGGVPAQGQTFSVSTAGLQIDSITVKVEPKFSLVAADTTLTLRINIVTVDPETEATTLFTVLTQSGLLQPIGDNQGPYITFQLDTPYAVLPGTTYGFDFSTNAEYFAFTSADDTAYTGGTAYTSQSDANATFRGLDRTFLITLSPVPEPSSVALAVLGSIGVMSMRRRQSARH
jgi:hypothetical protein